MYTVRRDTGKAEGKTTPSKTIRYRVTAPSTAKPRSRKKAPAKAGKKYVARKKS
jgi:hypothetical protein